MKKKKWDASVVRAPVVGLIDLCLHRFSLSWYDIHCRILAQKRQKSFFFFLLSAKRTISFFLEFKFFFLFASVRKMKRLRRLTKVLSLDRASRFVVQRRNNFTFSYSKHRSVDSKLNKHSVELKKNFFLSIRFLFDEFYKKNFRILLWLYEIFRRPNRVLFWIRSVSKRKIGCKLSVTHQSSPDMPECNWWLSRTP